MSDSLPRVKTRKRAEVTDTFYFDVHWSDGRTPDPGPGSFQSTNRQMTTSEGHTWPPPKRNGKIQRDVGGNFYTERERVRISPGWVDYHGTFPDGGTKYVRGSSYFPGDVPFIYGKPTDASLDAKGTTAIARVEPTRAVADVSVLLGELFREGLPSMLGLELWKKKAELARGAGSEYLNYQFGWKPLVSEVQNFAKAVKNARSILGQYERDAGRMVRRKYDFPIEKEIVDSRQFFSNGIPMTSHENLGGRKIVKTETLYTTKYWFAGAFTYFIPKHDELSQKLDSYVQYADKILGLEITPEVLWNLAPWSWAVDWFSNAGDVIHNASAFNQDHLVMRYGYIMCNQKVTKTNRWENTTDINGNSSAGWWEYSFERKIRRKATPYGFGVNLGSLSDYQWSILGALGMTRGPKLL